MLDVHVPEGGGERQFFRRIAAFWEETNAAGGEMRRGEAEKFIERRQSAGGDERCGHDFGGFDAGIMDFGGCAGLAGGFHEEGGFAAI